MACRGDFHCIPERANHGWQFGSDRQCCQLLGGLADTHKHQGNGAPILIPIGYRQRDALAVFFDPYNDELPRFDGARNFTCGNGNLVQVGNNHLVFKNFEHGPAWTQRGRDRVVLNPQSIG
jgi:hypothetical protein